MILHTAGFPQAPLGPPAWATLDGRLAAFARWRLNWEPGTSYEYHATSAHWVLADIVRRVTGLDHRDALEQRVTTPLGLPRVLGFEPGAAQDNIAELSCVGDPATPEEMKAVFGVAELGVTEVTAETLVRFNEPAARAVGVPGGGAIMRASDLALFYQALLHNTGEVWDGAVLTDATRHVRNTLPDRMTRIPANRALGVIQAGDDGHSNVRGFGRAVSAGAFGHNGAGGQLAWVDPASGLSLGYCTNGMDMHMVREARRGTAISSLAAVCVS